MKKKTYFCTIYYDGTASITFGVDGKTIGVTTPGEGGFWELGGFQGNNPWANAEHMAPFDREVDTKIKYLNLYSAI